MFNSIVPILSGSFGILVVSFRYLYFQYTDHLSGVQLENIFPHSVFCLLTWLTVSFAISVQSPKGYQYYTAPQGTWIIAEERSRKIVRVKGQWGPEWNSIFWYDGTTVLMNSPKLWLPAQEPHKRSSQSTTFQHGKRGPHESPQLF